jgi:hypothetical protein
MRIPLRSRVQNPFRSTSIDKLLTVAGVTPNTRAKPSGAIPIGPASRTARTNRTSDGVRSDDMRNSVSEINLVHDTTASAPSRPYALLRMRDRAGRPASSYNSET